MATLNPRGGVEQPWSYSRFVVPRSPTDYFPPCRFFETLSFLPPLTDDQISKQVPSTSSTELCVLDFALASAKFPVKVCKGDLALAYEWGKAKSNFCSLSDGFQFQIDYIVNNGWTACLEFANEEDAYVKNVNNVRFGPVSAGYYDNR